MYKVLILFLLCIGGTAQAWDLIEIEDLSVSYRQYLSQPEVAGSLSYSTPAVSLAVPNGAPISIPSDVVSFPLPQVQYICDTQARIKLNIFEWFYYRTNMDMMLMNVQFITLNQDVPLVTLTNAIGASYKGFTIEYTVEDRLINNVYLNALFPSNNSVLFQYQILGKDK